MLYVEEEVLLEALHTGTDKDASMYLEAIQEIINNADSEDVHITLNEVKNILKR